MDLRKVKESKQLEDHTGYGTVDKLLDTMFTMLNPVYAMRNVTGAARQGIDLRNTKPSGNVVDQTATSGAMRSRFSALHNFLNAHLLNQKSLPSEDYYSGLGDLPQGRMYPERPVEGPRGNVILDLLTNPQLFADERRSMPNHDADYSRDLLNNRYDDKRPVKGSSKK